MRHPPARLTLCGVVLVALTAAAAGAMAFAASADLPGRVLEVAVKDGRLSLRAHQARLADVLEAIGQQASVRIVLHGDLDAPVTDTFADLPLDEGVRRLSRWHSLVLIYKPSPGRADRPVLTEVWVAAFSPGSGRAEPAAQSKRDDLLADAGRQVDPSGLTMDTTSPLMHRNPAVRVRAIQALVREQGESVPLEALREFATRDPAPEVRLAAIRALASLNRLEAGDVLKTALDDHDPAIRAAANQAFGRWRHRARDAGLN